MSMSSKTTPFILDLFSLCQIQLAGLMKELFDLGSTMDRFYKALTFTSPA